MSPARTYAEFPARMFMPQLKAVKKLRKVISLFRALAACALVALGPAAVPDRRGTLGALDAAANFSGARCGE